MMKTYLFFVGACIVMVLGAMAIAGAQSPVQQPAQFEITVSDNQCNDTQNCLEPFTDCSTSAVFRVPHGGTYYLTVSLSCPGTGDCKYCLACASLITESGRTVCVVHTTCEQDDCSLTAACGGLDINTNYRLVVCKRACSPFACSSCPAECTATARLKD